MRILMLDTRPVRRGAQVFLHDLKKQFVSSGMIVHRIFLYKENHFESLPLDHDDSVLDFEDDNWMEKWFFFQPTLVTRLSQQINKFNPDVILCNGSRTLKYAALVKKINPNLKAKWVYRVIDSAKYWNRNPFVVLAYRKFVISAMDAAVGVSNKSLDEMKAHYRFTKPSIAIPRAVDIPHFDNFVPPPDLRNKIGIPEAAFVVLFLGNFTKQKRPDRFVEVIRTVKEKYSHVHGLMVGDGPLKNEIVNAVKLSGIEKSFTFAGYQQDVRPFIFMCNLLMITSDTEGLPGVMLEAASMGKLTITGPVGGVSEFIFSGKNGIVLKQNEISFYSDALDHILSSPLIASEMEMKALNDAKMKFSLQKVFTDYQSFFQKVMVD